MMVVIFSVVFNGNYGRFSRYTITHSWNIAIICALKKNDISYLVVKNNSVYDISINAISATYTPARRPITVLHNFHFFVFGVFVFEIMEERGV